METDVNDDWVERLSSDDEPTRDAALAQLRAKLEPALKRTLTDRYGGQLQLDDVIQDATLRILDSLDQFAGESRFMTWAITIATRIGLTELRRRRYKDVSLTADSVDILNRENNGGLSAEDGVDRKRILGKLDALISNELTDKQRVAIRGMLDGLPAEEIASRLGSNRNAVYKLVHDARMQLKDGLAGAGITADDVGAIFA